MTCEQLQKIAWLNRAFYADKKAKAWLAKLEQDRSFAERISKSFSGSGSYQSGNSTEDALIRLAETERHTQEKLAELVKIREEIMLAIEKIPDDDMQTILMRHYLKYETWETVAQKMHYSVRNIKYKHKAALDKLCIVLHSDM